MFSAPAEVFGKRSATAAPSVADVPFSVAPVAKPAAVPLPAVSGSRVLLCGTYPVGQSNGYSRVVYYICKYLGLREDIALTVYGFQNYNQTSTGLTRNDIPPRVRLHDALATENPRRHGFGEKEIGTFLKANPQDVVIIFNDPVVVGSLTQTIVNELGARPPFKLVCYMDQVYPYQKKAYIELLNKYFDYVITFTPYWKEVAAGLGIVKPIYFFPHGFDAGLYYPVPRAVCRAYFKIPDDAFAVLNLNRNVPRKRWDHTMMAWAQVIARHREAVSRAILKDKPLPKPIVLVIGAEMTNVWNLMEILEHELKRLKVDATVADYVIPISRPQQLSDREINVLYNACDIGLNTCDGEGFGLCQFEHAAVGCPQVAPNVGGFREFLHPKNSTLIEPKWTFYIDNQRDGIGGRPEVSDPADFAEAIWKYYTNPALVVNHGTRARRDILQHYRWNTMVDHFYGVLKNILGNKTPA